MVKLEWHEGGSVFVRADLVVSINPTCDGGSCITMNTNTARADIVYVKGTPEEVHAALFPKASGVGFTDTESNEAMLRVLRWVLEDAQAARIPIINDARKALGMETP